MRRNWLGREVAGQGIPGRGIRMCSLLCVEGLDVFLGVRKLGGAVRKWAECKGEMGSMAEGEVSEGGRF